MADLPTSAFARAADPATDAASSLSAAPLDPTRDRPLRPEDDPFVTAPVDLAALRSGTIIRIREVEVAFLGIVPQKVSAWQLLYRSNDLDGAPEVALTTVLLPHGADPAQPRPLLTYQCAIDAISSVCFPSYALRRGARSWGAVPPLELLLLANLLCRGWALSIPDHEGLQGRFGAAREPGFRTLDGIRAALHFAPLGLHPETAVGIFGYSGGGMASSWAAEMAPEYAPELNIVGAVLGAPVGDPGQTFLRLNGGFFAGFPAMVVAGLRSGYPELDRVIDEHASVTGRRRLKQLEDITTIGAVAKFRGDDFGDYLDAPMADVLGTPEVLHVLDDLRLGRCTPSCPLLIVQGVHDQVIHIDDVDEQVQRYIEAGATVKYVRDCASEHNSLHILAMPLVLTWLSDRFARRPAPTGTRTVRSVAFSRMAVRGYLAMAIAAVATVLGRPLRSRGLANNRFGAFLAAWAVLLMAPPGFAGADHVAPETNLRTSSTWGHIGGQLYQSDWLLRDPRNRRLCINQSSDAPFDPPAFSVDAGPQTIRVVLRKPRRPERLRIDGSPLLDSRNDFLQPMAMSHELKRRNARSWVASFPVDLVTPNYYLDVRGSWRDRSCPDGNRPGDRQSASWGFQLQTK